MWYLVQHLPTSMQTWRTWNYCLEHNQCVDDDRWKINNQNPHRYLPQTYEGRKSVCTVSIRPTEDLLTHMRTSFRINKLWSNKYYTHKSIINKKRLEQRTWRIFYANQINQLTQKILNTQPEPPTATFHKLVGGQICMSGFDTSHRQFTNTPEDKFQGQ